MNILENVPQGSAAWLAIRTQYNTASEAPAALGASKYLSRSDLLKQKSTGLTPEVCGAKQALFDRGHQSEARARSLAEAIIGTELFPVTATFSVDGIDLLASMDGATMDETIIWEHKLFSERLANDVRAGMLDPHYTIQLDQQLLVSGAKKCLFMTSDGTETNMAWCWYEYDQAKADALLAGWRQFRADLATYVPPVVIAEAVGHTPETLPALRIEVTGMVTASNLADYKAHALAVFGGINRELTTDQQFADAEKVVKWCGDVEDRLAAAKQHALSQTASIDELFRAIDDISAEARRTRLELDKLVKARKEAVRGEIVAEGVAALRAHIDGLNQRLGKPYMPVITADFGGAVKGKRTVDSLRDAVSTTLANAKIDASAIADRIGLNLAMLRDHAANHAFLFADAAQIVLKAHDYLTILVKSRIAEHQAAELAKEEATRERIRAEEAAKASALIAAATAKAEKDAREAIQSAAAATVVHEPAASAPVLSEPELAMAHIERNGRDSLGSTFPGHPAAVFDMPTLLSMNRCCEKAVTEGVAVCNDCAENWISQPESDLTAPADDGNRINLGAINEHLAPIKLDAAGLEQLGFVPVAIVKASKQYRACDLPPIRRALTEHLSRLSELQTA